MNKICTFTLRDRDVELLYQNGKLAYSFDYKGKPYGSAVVLAGRGILDTASATFLLFTNAIETMDKLEKDEN